MKFELDEKNTPDSMKKNNYGVDMSGKDFAEGDMIAKIEKIERRKRRLKKLQINPSSNWAIVGLSVGSIAIMAIVSMILLNLY